MSRTRLIILITVVVTVVGFFLMRAPAPVIAIAAEPVVSIGGYTITNTILSAWVVIVILLIGAWIIHRRTSNLEEAIVPSGLQNLVEAIYEAFFNVVSQVAGERNGRKFFPVVFTIFIFLLAGNWFGLFPWNNVVGRVENFREHYLHEMELQALEVRCGLLGQEAEHEGSGADETIKCKGEDEQRPVAQAEIAAINQTFANHFFAPIPFGVDEQDDADGLILDARGNDLTAIEAAVRAEFAANPIPLNTAADELVHAIEARLEAGGVEDHGHHEVDYALAFNLPLSDAEANLVRATGPILSGGGFKVIPPRTLFDEPRDYSYDGYSEPVYFNGGEICLPAAGSETAAGDCAGAPAATTVNTSHLGFMLRLEEKGFQGDTVGHIFPFFRAIATDLNLPLAIALWSLIMVQFWGVRGIGARNNFGKYLGLGSHAVVKGPMGLFVGILEIISEVGRVVSFTFRLFGNIFAGEVVLFISMFLIAFIVPSIFFGLEVFVGFIQAFVFAMLTLVFASAAVAGHDDHDEEHGEGEASGAH